VKSEAAISGVRQLIDRAGHQDHIHAPEVPWEIAGIAADSREPGSSRFVDVSLDRIKESYVVSAVLEPRRMYSGPPADVGDRRWRRWHVPDQELARSLPLQLATQR
jgi:hypothetical protein